MKILIAVAALALIIGCEKSKGSSKDEAPAPTAVDRPGATVARSTGGGTWVELPVAGLLAAIKTEAATAVKAGTTPYLYLHADWCAPCVEIEKTRHTDDRMKAAFAGTHIMAVDIDKADPAALASFGVKVEVIPIFFRLTADGAMTGASIDGGAWGDNIAENMAPPLTAFFATK